MTKSTSHVTANLLEWPIAVLHGKVNKLTDLQCFFLLSSILVEGEKHQKTTNITKINSAIETHTHWQLKQ